MALGGGLASYVDFIEVVEIMVQKKESEVGYLKPASD